MSGIHIRWKSSLSVLEAESSVTSLAARTPVQAPFLLGRGLYSITALQMPIGSSKQLRLVERLGADWDVHRW